MKDELDWSYAEMAKIMDSDSPAAVKSSVSRKISSFAKLVVGVFEEMRGKKR